MEQQTIGIGNMLLDLFIHPCCLSYIRINAVIARRAAACNNIRRHVLRKSRAGLYHGILPYTGIRFLDDIRQNDCTVIDFTVARYLCTIAEDATIADNSVMADMRTLHQEVV